MSLMTSRFSRFARYHEDCANMKSPASTATRVPNIWWTVSCPARRFNGIYFRKVEYSFLDYQRCNLFNELIVIDIQETCPKWGHMHGQDKVRREDLKLFHCLHKFDVIIWDDGEEQDRCWFSFVLFQWSVLNKLLIKTLERNDFVNRTFKTSFCIDCCTCQRTRLAALASG